MSMVSLAQQLQDYVGHLILTDLTNVGAVHVSVYPAMMNLVVLLNARSLFGEDLSTVQSSKNCINAHSLIPATEKRFHDKEMKINGYQIPQCSSHLASGRMAWWVHTPLNTRPTSSIRRYYVSSFMKVVIAQLLMSYDFKLVKPEAPHWISRVAKIPRPWTKVAFTK
ncbi:hypothetical protein EV127DRAFT_414621 [Xylaria flabelliformis]|nr:hypothetical protein EV127DRAFT_414621 [Xylaria flabelliformis]